MSDINWSAIFLNCDSLASMSDDFVNICNSAIADHVPKVVIKEAKPKSRAVKNALRQKNKAHKIYRRDRNEANLKKNLKLRPRL